MSYEHPLREPDEIRRYRDTPQGPLRLHFFRPRPPANEPTPAIVFFFGGGWKAGSPAQFYPQCMHFSARGMMAISAEYRVADRHGTDPGCCVEDGKAALRWVRTHAAELGIAPDRIAAGGGSAGGHVALCCGALAGFDDAPDGGRCTPDALVLFNPVLDNGPGGYGHDRVKEYWEQFSPLHNLHAGLPPTIVFLGTEDALIPVQTITRFAEQMHALGVRCEPHFYPGEKHAFFNHSGYADTLGKTDRFLTSLGFLPQASPE